MALSLASTEFLAHLGGNINQPGPFSVWVRTTATASNFEFISRHDSTSSNAGFGLVLNNGGSGLLTMYGKNPGGTQRLTIPPFATTLNDGNWHHLGVNIWYATGNANQIWIDGVLKGSASASNTFGASTQPMRLGRSNDTFWSGGAIEFADFASWGGGGFGQYLTADEWAALAKGLRPEAVKMDGLKHHMPLVRTARDLVGYNGDQPTLTGGAWTNHPRLVGDLV